MKLKIKIFLIVSIFLFSSNLITLFPTSTIFADHECPSGHGYDVFTDDSGNTLCRRIAPDPNLPTSCNLPGELYQGSYCVRPTLEHDSDPNGSGNPVLWFPADLPDSPTGDKFTEEHFISELISDILPIIFGIAGFIAVIIIIISGIQLVLSSGNPEAAAAARGRLTMAIIGFAIILLAFALTQIIDRIFLGGTGIF